MEVSLQEQAKQLASELASQAETVEDLNSLMRLMMKSAMERMLRVFQWDNFKVLPII